jgi:hypothetical protein
MATPPWVTMSHFPSIVCPFGGDRHMGLPGVGLDFFQSSFQGSVFENPHADDTGEGTAAYRASASNWKMICDVVVTSIRRDSFGRVMDSVTFLNNGGD